MVNIRVTTSGSSANLGPGFDVFAIALEEPFDVVEVEYEESKNIEIELKVGGKYKVPSKIEENVLTALLLQIMEKKKQTGKISISLNKNVPVGMGLGSSAASCVAAVLIANEIFNLKMSKKDLIYLAGEGEKIVAGSVHYDNVTASLLGGFVIIPMNSLDPIRIDLKSNLNLCIVMPKLNLPIKKTEFARKILPQNISLKQMSENIAKASRVVYSFLTDDFSQLKEAMKDYVVEIHRSKFIPAFEDVRNAAYENGALGVCISGAGPSIVAFVDKESIDPNYVLKSMLEAFEKNGVEAEGFITKVGKGAKIEYLD